MFALNDPGFGTFAGFAGFGGAPEAVQADAREYLAALVERVEGDRA
jgi:hypothetical protein